MNAKQLLHHSVIIQNYLLTRPQTSSFPIKSFSYRSHINGRLVIDCDIIIVNITMQIFLLRSKKRDEVCYDLIKGLWRHNFVEILAILLFVIT